MDMGKSSVSIGPEMPSDSGGQAADSYFPRKVLLVPVGGSPAVVTETLYAMLSSGTQPPTEIQLITTTFGKAIIEQCGLRQKIRDMYADCGFDADPNIPLQIEILKSADGQELEDIRTTDETEHAGNQIARAIKRITDDEHCVLHASIAGGRKTMGYDIAKAMGLLARPQDRQSHVLVSEDFENNRHFFWPTLLKDENGNVIADAREAKVDLAYKSINSQRASIEKFIEQVDPDHYFINKLAFRAYRSQQDPSLHVNWRKLEVVAEGVPIKLQPRPMSQIMVFCHHACRGQPMVRMWQGKATPIRPWDKTIPPLSELDFEAQRVLMADALALELANQNALNRREELLTYKKMDNKDVTRLRNVYETLIQALLDQYIAHDYLLISEGESKQRRLGLRIDPAYITFEDPLEQRYQEQLNG